MISIIISSADATQLAKVSENINKTIGIPYEIISYDNAEGTCGLTKVYNESVQKATYDMLCFMHEDIEFHTNNWGDIVLSSFGKNPRLGLLGIAGRNNKSSIPGGGNSSRGTTYINVIQHYKFQDSPPKHIQLPENPVKRINRVVCLDGVWFCCPKKIAQRYPFDENLTGFHGYDIDFSLAVGEAYEIAVTFDVLMSHFSEGNFSKEWLNAMIYIHKKRKKQLPKYLEIYPDISLEAAEKKTFKDLLRTYRDTIGITFKDGVKILNSSNIRSLNLFLYIKLYYYVIRILLFRK